MPVDDLIQNFKIILCVNKDPRRRVRTEDILQSDDVTTIFFPQGRVAESTKSAEQRRCGRVALADFSSLTLRTYEKLTTSKFPLSALDSPLSTLRSPTSDL